MWQRPCPFVTRDIAALNHSLKEQRQHSCCGRFCVQLVGERSEEPGRLLDAFERLNGCVLEGPGVRLFVKIAFRGGRSASDVAGHACPSCKAATTKRF